MGGEPLNLTWRQRASWLSHFAKAALRDHHRELEPLFGPLLKPDAVVIDVGAHGGQMSRMFMRLAPKGEAHSFEPARYARSVLEPALALRNAKRVHVWPYALSDHEGEVTMAIPIKASTALGFGQTHVAQPNEAGAFRFEHARATTLDTFVREQTIARIDFIKVDIEGWELHFLNGARATLERFRPILFLEVADGLLRRAGDTPEALFDFLRTLNYRAEKLMDPAAFAPVDEFSGDGDYLFLQR